MCDLKKIKNRYSSSIHLLKIELKTKAKICYFYVTD